LSRRTKYAAEEKYEILKAYTDGIGSKVDAVCAVCIVVSMSIASVVGAAFVVSMGVLLSLLMR
jgi:hypothetical protein